MAKLLVKKEINVSAVKLWYKLKGFTIYDSSDEAKFEIDNLFSGF